MNSIPQYICPHFHYSLVNRGHLSRFHLLAFVTRATINMAEQVSVKKDVKIFGHTLRDGMARSYGRFITRFLINFHTGF